MLKSDWLQKTAAKRKFLKKKTRMTWSHRAPRKNNALALLANYELWGPKACNQINGLELLQHMQL